MKNMETFFKEHKLKASDFDMGKLVETFTGDMISGLEGKSGALRMIPTYIEAENDLLKDVPVLAIDAGGTNFRAALVSINRDGKIMLENIINDKMPGIEEEISEDEFFSTIAGYIKSLADKSHRIGFCFSYPTEILPTRDGRLIQFCKEIKAPGVVGQLIGTNLLKTLGTPEKQIVILNDTVATLLAGKSASVSKTYDTFIGFILGTGTNTCYIEQNRNILKKRDLDREGSQIINIESGNFNKAPRTDLDLVFDSKTADPGNYTFEKMFSGGYFGGLCLSVLKAAAKEEVFSPQTAGIIDKITDLSSNEANIFICKQDSPENKLAGLITDKSDKEKSVLIINTLIERASKLVAANLAAVVLKTGKGLTPNRPVLITIEGTAFYNLYNLKTLFEHYFNEYLSGDRKRYMEFTKVDQSSLVGAALAALIE